MDNPTDQRDQRLRNLQALVERGIEPYAYSFERTHTAAQLKERHPDLRPGDRVEGEDVTVAGRVMLLRMLGKLTFATLQDQSGRVQVSFERSRLDDYNALKKLDLGDWLEVTGQVYATKTGELTVDAASYRLLAKALRPLPSKHHGLQDKELRYRQRYLDTIMNPEARRAFELRAGAIAYIRRYLDERASSRSRPRCCRPSRAAPKRGRSSRTTTRWTTTSTCASRWSSTSSG